MPSYKELCLHQKRRPFNIKKYTLRWPLMWEMHDVLIIFYLHCDIWNILENIDWHYFCMQWIMRRSSLSRKFPKLVIIYHFKSIIIILASRKTKIFLLYVNLQMNTFILDYASYCGRPCPSIVYHHGIIFSTFSLQIVFAPAR